MTTASIHDPSKSEKKKNFTVNKHKKNELLVRRVLSLPNVF